MKQFWSALSLGHDTFGLRLQSEAKRCFLMFENEGVQDEAFVHGPESRSGGVAPRSDLGGKFAAKHDTLAEAFPN